MGFVEGSIEGEKVFGGRVFPKTLLPPSTLESPGTCDLVELVKAERGWLTDTLQQHRAILFRGFNLCSAEDFACVVEAFGWDEFGYESAAGRKMVADRVYTANEIPLDVFIPFHHEMALIKRFPPKLFFFCLQPSPEGGQTSILPSDIVVERMEETVPGAVQRLVQDGMRFVMYTTAAYKRDTNSDSAVGDVMLWQQMFKTTDQQEAEKRALEKMGCNSVKFNDDGTVDFCYGPMNPIREYDGKRVWFNTMLGFSLEEMDARATFSDGSPLPSDATAACEEILEEICVDVSWQKGDVLLLNNFAVQHARRPGKPPRVVLVSMSN